MSGYRGEIDGDDEVLTREIKLYCKVVDMYKTISSIFWSEFKLISKHFDEMFIIKVSIVTGILVMEHGRNFLV